IVALALRLIEPRDQSWGAGRVGFITLPKETGQMGFLESDTPERQHHPTEGQEPRHRARKNERTSDPACDQARIARMTDEALRPFFHTSLLGQVIPKMEAQVGFTPAEPYDSGNHQYYAGCLQRPPLEKRGESEVPVID